MRRRAKEQTSLQARGPAPRHFAQKIAVCTSNQQTGELYTRHGARIWRQTRKQSMVSGMRRCQREYVDNPARATGTFPKNGDSRRDLLCSGNT